MPRLARAGLAANSQIGLGNGPECTARIFVLFCIVLVFLFSLLLYYWFGWSYSGYFILFVAVSHSSLMFSRFSGPTVSLPKSVHATAVKYFRLGGVPLGL